MIKITPTILIPDAELTWQFARSGGPGGQNVNKLNTKAQLRWDLKNSTLPTAVLERFRQTFGTRIVGDDEVLIASEETRNQLKNREICEEKLAQMIRSVLRPPKKRKKTKPTRASKERRIQAKKQVGEKKQSRQSFRPD